MVKPFHQEEISCLSWPNENMIPNWSYFRLKAFDSSRQNRMTDDLKSIGLSSRAAKWTLLPGVIAYKDTNFSRCSSNNSSASSSSASQIKLIQFGCLPFILRSSSKISNCPASANFNQTLSVKINYKTFKSNFLSNSNKINIATHLRRKWGNSLAAAKPVRLVFISLFLSIVKEL